MKFQSRRSSIADGLRLHKVSAFATCGSPRDVSRRDSSPPILLAGGPRHTAKTNRIESLRVTNHRANVLHPVSHGSLRIVANLITIMACSLGSQPNGTTARLFPESFQQASRRELPSICRCNQGPWTIVDRIQFYVHLNFLSFRSLTLLFITYFCCSCDFYVFFLYIIYYYLIVFCFVNNVIRRKIT